MKQLLKSWLPIISGTKKYLAADLAHQLSRIINRRKFEVVYEGFIDLHNIDSEQPDIVIYDKENNLKAIMIVEICDNENFLSTRRTIEILSQIYQLEESFIYNMDTEKWYLIKKGDLAFEANSWSLYFWIDLNKLMYQKTRVWSHSLFKKHTLNLPLS